MRPNPNFTALRAALTCDIPEMKAAARKVVEDSIAKHETLTDAGEALGVTYLGMNRLRKLMAPAKAKKSKR
jgi:hypothetical protein